MIEFAPFTTRESARAKSAAHLLRTGAPVSDETLDEIFPPAVKRLSAAHWTPVDVAVRAASLLAPSRTARVLDIGAGPGKFCLVAAAVTGAIVCGVEQRPYLASVAREAARRMSVAVDIREGSFESEDPAAFDGIYLFNPFTISLVVPGVRDDVEQDRHRARADIERAEEFLRGARTGARVATFCGFGGSMPASFEPILQERCGGGTLEIWTKTGDD